MSIFSKSDSIAKLESELARLTKKRETLASRLVAAQSAEASARDAQRRYLVESDDADVSKGAKHAADVASASADVTAIEDAIQTVDALIAEGRQAVTAAKEGAARAKRASEIQERIKKLEPMAATAESLFEKLADVLTKIVELADDRDLVLREYRVIHGPGSPLSAATLTGAALTEALFRALPDGFSVSKMATSTYAAANLPLMVRRDDGLSPDLPLDTDAGPGFRPLPLSGALTENIITPLRAAAAEILDGTRPLATAKTMIAEPETEDAPVMEWRRLILVKPIRWRDWSGELIETPDSDVTIPEPVAIAAKLAGVAFDHGSREGEHHLDRRIERGFHNDATIMNKEIVDLKIAWPSTTREAA